MDEMAPSILIVDDHPSFRSTAPALLDSDEASSVVGEPRRPSALAAVAGLRPDVVLLDVQLPDLDGFAVAAALRSEPAGPPLRRAHLEPRRGRLRPR